MARWCRLWIPNFGSMAKPLYEAIKGPAEMLEWTPEHRKGFDDINVALMKVPALGLSHLAKPFELYVHERGH